MYLGSFYRSFELLLFDQILHKNHHLLNASHICSIFSKKWSFFWCVSWFYLICWKTDRFFGALNCCYLIRFSRKIIIFWMQVIFSQIFQKMIIFLRCELYLFDRIVMKKWSFFFSFELLLFDQIMINFHEKIIVFSIYS